MKSNRYKNGVTIMEMLVVLLIVGMLSLIAMPTFFGFTKNARLKGAARIITSALRNARSYAITKRINHTVSIYLIENTITIYETPDNIKKIKVSEPDIIDIRYNNGGNPGSETIREVTFAPDGTATTVLSDNSIRIYDTAEHYIQIRVYPATGSAKTGDIDTDI